MIDADSFSDEDTFGQGTKGKTKGNTKNHTIPLNKGEMIFNDPDDIDDGSDEFSFMGFRYMHVNSILLSNVILCYS